MRVGVLGLGSAGARHARHLLALGHTVVGFDPGEVPTPDGVTRALGVPELTSEVDAVVVATPSSLHGEGAMVAIRAGRHVLVEKPFAAGAAEADAVARAAERAGVVCAVAMNLRFHPGVMRLRDQVAHGDVGVPRLVLASFGYDLRRWRPATDYRRSYSAQADLGGGIIADAIHELDYLLWLFGPVDEVSARAERLSDLEVDVEDTAAAILKFASGAVGVIDLNFFEPVYRRGCTVVGDRAVATWRWDEPYLVIEDGAGAVMRHSLDLEDLDPYREELADFVAAIEEGRPPATPAWDGVRAVALADAIRQSARERRTVTIA